MKKLSLYIFLVLMWCNVGFAECIKGDCINGYGTYTWADGNKYVGEWKDDKFHGQGTFTGTDGGNYVGGFKNGKKYGQGTLTYANGTIDKGIWQDAKLKWQISFDRAKVLNGVWAINQPIDSFLNESKSGHNFVDEKIYIYKHWVGFANADHICEILSTEHPFIVSKNSKKFGVKENSYVVLRTNCKNNEGKFGFDNIFIANKGSLIFFQYSTDFEERFFTFSIDMIPEGQPNPFHNSFERDEVKFVKINNVTREIDENKFLGQFKHKFKDLNQTENTLSECKGSKSSKWTNCKGVYTFESGSKYVGQYKDGKRNGQGTYIWADGDKYVGEFKDDEPHGQGTFTWANGNKYVGEYKDGKIHGQGTFTWTDGSKYVGEFKDDEQHGQGTFTWASGNKYVGEFKDGNEHGQGTFTWTDGSKYVGEFKDDEQHGQGTFTTADGTVEKGIWENGKLIKQQTASSTASSTEINNAILKCADYEYTKDMKQNFFKYMYESVTQKTDVTNWNKVNKSLNLRISPSDYLYRLIKDLTIAGYNKQEISIFLKNKLENRTSDFESLEEKDKLLILSIRQQHDSWIESLNLFLRKTPVEKRKYDDYGVWFLTCESRSKKDADSFVEKYSNIN